jgi:hypothetical protein
MSTKKNENASRVRIAVSDVASELSFECPSTPAEIKSAVTAALSANTPLILTDIRGHEIVVPAAKIGFIEIGEPVERRVGFGVN